MDGKQRKYAKKPMRKARKYAKRPRQSVARIASAVKKLQSMTDGEKKRFTTFYGGTLGQVFNNSDGAAIIDVTPGLTQGVQTNQRTGASVRLHSTNYQFQISQQLSLETAVKYKLTWIAIKGAPYDSATLITQWFNNAYNPNPFISGANIRDLNAQYNPDYFGTYKVLRTVTGKVSPDQLTGTTTNHTFNVGLKYNRGKGHDLRWNQNLGTSANLFNGQIVLVMQIDRGNAGPINSTVVGLLPTSASANTGLYVQYNKIDYYYDN